MTPKQFRRLDPSEQAEMTASYLIDNLINQFDMESSEQYSKKKAEKEKKLNKNKKNRMDDLRMRRR